MTILEFLEARIAEDEAEANAMLDSFLRGGEVSKRRWVRVLAECAAKRVIIELADQVETMDYQITNEWGGDLDGTGDDILKALSAVYKDHSDYQQEWAL
jgi:hypothetical protein